MPRLKKNKKFSARQEAIIDCLLSDYSCLEIGQEFDMKRVAVAVAITKIKKKLGIPFRIKLTREDWLFYILREFITLDLRI